MIQFKLVRSHLKDTYTIGDLYIDYGDGKGYVFFYMVEVCPKIREIKYI